MADNTTLFERIESSPKRELYLFGLYRILGASLVTGLIYSPLASLIPPSTSPRLASGASLIYLTLAIALLMWARWQSQKTERVAIVSVIIDIIAATLISYAIPGVEAGIAMILLFNIAATASLLRLGTSLLIAIIAGIATSAEYLWSHVIDMASQRSLAELMMFVASYLSGAFVCQRIAQRARSSQALAERRHAQVINLSEINELIIRRMRTGVLVVDGEDRLALVNEAAALLIGHNPLSQGDQLLRHISPELDRRLCQWRKNFFVDKKTLRLHPNLPEVQPHFVRLLADSEIVLIFLDDPRVVSRRAESLTLNTMGRFSASLAHEIRNPLTVIQHAAQLLQESSTLNEADQRLPEIILQQCKRTNGIVDSVLALARRERSKPENFDVNEVIRACVDEFRTMVSIQNARIEVRFEKNPLPALFDPRQLYQVITTLIHNAVTHGHLPEQPAHVLVWTSHKEHNAMIEVTDNGPGISPDVIDRLFQPFFTTSEHGTGLGLYIANELCNANQACLSYHKSPGGGACFRLSLPTLHKWIIS